jgi:16S rRNA (cytidine1402-2'-O)-methyltransferase
MTAALYLIPAPLGGNAAEVLPPGAARVVRSLKDFAVEDAKSARAYLAGLGMPCAIRELNVCEIGEDTAALLAPLRAGRSLGVISEAGCPAVADPGAALVAAAHHESFRVIPLAGASAIVLALMASGLEGQRFAFCGYLPRDKSERAERIRCLEQRSRTGRETQIFIETPYRNDALLEALLATCDGGTRLCVATDLTLPTEEIAMRTIAQWRRSSAPIGRRPAVFLLLA